MIRITEPAQEYGWRDDSGIRRVVPRLEEAAKQRFRSRPPPVATGRQGVKCAGADAGRSGWGGRGRPAVRDLRRPQRRCVSADVQSHAPCRRPAPGGRRAEAEVFHRLLFAKRVLSPFPVQDAASGLRSGSLEFSPKVESVRRGTAYPPVVGREASRSGASCESAVCRSSSVGSILTHFLRRSLGTDSRQIARTSLTST